MCQSLQAQQGVIYLCMLLVPVAGMCGRSAAPRPQPQLLQAAAGIRRQPVLEGQMGRALVQRASLRLADRRLWMAKLRRTQLLVGLSVAMMRQAGTQMAQEPWKRQGYLQKPREQSAMCQLGLQNAASASGCWNMCDCLKHGFLVSVQPSCNFHVIFQLPCDSLCKTCSPRPICGERPGHNAEVMASFSSEAPIQVHALL